MTSITNSLASDFHNQLIQENGVEKATGFSEKGQRKRFEVLADYCRTPLIGSLLDYGCNVGDFAHYYYNERGRIGSYYGVDTNLKFVQYGEERFKSFNRIFFQGSILEEATYSQLRFIGPFDIVFASGVFCYRDQVDDHPEMLERLWSLAGKMMVVNFLSNLVPVGARSPNPIHCFYDPSFVGAIARKLGTTCFSLHHDYLANDFTVALYRDFPE